MSANSTDLVNFLLHLRQVREYTPEPLSDEAINTILEVGRWSGSSANKQLTEVIVVRDAAVKEHMGEWGAKPAATCDTAFLIVSPSGMGFDEGRLAERLMLAAKALGLGAGVATLKEEGPEKIKPLLNIPAELNARVVVSVGHIDVEARRALPPRPGGPRKAASAFVHRDRY